MAPLVRDRSRQDATDNQSNKNIKSYVHVMIIINLLGHVYIIYPTQQ